MFDRRHCRSWVTALKKLGQLRMRGCGVSSVWVGPWTNCKSPTLDKALLFLDDELLGSTSNAVERGNRRFRKRLCTASTRSAPQQTLRRRLALDLHREQRAGRRARTMKIPPLRLAPDTILGPHDAIADLDFLEKILKKFPAEVACLLAFFGMCSRLGPLEGLVLCDR